MNPNKDIQETKLEEIRVHLSKLFKHEYTKEWAIKFLIAHFHNNNYEDIKNDNR
jgi:hypothetical protein